MEMNASFTVIMRGIYALDPAALVVVFKSWPISCSWAKLPVASLAGNGL